MGSIPEHAESLLELDLMTLIGHFQLKIFCDSKDFDKVQDYPSIAIFFKYFGGSSNNKGC